MNPWLAALMVSSGVVLVDSARALLCDWRRHRERAAYEKTRGQRWYAWINTSGREYRRALAPDACRFWLDSFATGSVIQPSLRKEGEPDRSLSLRVVATGERVLVSGTPGQDARLVEP